VTAPARLVDTWQNMSGSPVTPQQSVRLSHARCRGATTADVAPRHWLWHEQHYELHQCKWHDSFISHARLTDVTQKGQIWGNFGRVHFSKILLKGQITEKILSGPPKQAQLQNLLIPGTIHVQHIKKCV
jgi:hypothetical protein